MATFVIFCSRFYLLDFFAPLTCATREEIEMGNCRFFRRTNVSVGGRGVVNYLT